MAKRKAWWDSLFAAIDGKHAQAFAQFLTHDAEFRFGGQPSVYGQDNVAACVEAFFGMIGSSRHQLLGTWEGDGSLVCEGIVSYTRLDGSQVEMPFANVLHMRGDRIARYLIYIDIGPLFGG